jgi:thiol-disulfide isomerase/thioredoxin
MSASHAPSGSGLVRRMIVSGLLGLGALIAVLASFIVTQNSQDIRPVLIVACLGFFGAAAVAPRGRGALNWVGGLTVALSGMLAAMALSKFGVAFTARVLLGLYLAAAALAAAAGVAVRWLGARRRPGSAVAFSLVALAAAVGGAFFLVPKLLDAQSYATVDRAVPPFTFRTLDGQTISSDAWRGRAVVVAYWATWCTPCMAEMPKLAALQAKYRNDPRVTIVAMDAGYGGDTAERARAFLARRNLGLTSAIDDIKPPGAKKGLGAGALGLQVVPTLFILNPAGRLVGIHTGYDKAEDLTATLSRHIDQLAAKGAS